MTEPLLSVKGLVKRFPVKRAGSGNLNNCDKCNFCLRAA